MIRGNYWWIYLHDDGVDWWHRARGVSEPLAKGSCKDTSEIPAPDGAEMVLCIPGEKVRSHQVRMPTRNRRKALESLNFALEDKLLHDTENYHLVPILETGLADEITVAIIEKSYLHNLIDSFQDQQWHLRYIAPDYYFIQVPDKDSWLLDVSTEPFLLSMPDIASGSIISGELNSHAPGALLLAMESAPKLPRRLYIRVSDKNQAQKLSSWSMRVNEQDIEIQIINDQISRHDWLARAELPSESSNLLTGAYTSKDKSIRNIKHYVPITGLAAALIILLIADWVASGIRLEAEFNRLQRDIDETYLSLFPDARNLSEPRYQMEQNLIQARASSGIDSGLKSGFFSGLEQISEIIGSMDNQLQKLQFDDSGFTLEVSVPDYESLEQLQSRLSGHIPGEVESAELKEGRVYARLVLGGGE